MLDRSLSDEEVIRKCVESGTSDDWLKFIERFHDAIRLAVLRAARPWRDVRAETLDDLIQDTYLKLCNLERRTLAKFTPQYKGSAAAFIATVARHLVIDHFKSIHTPKHGEGLVQVVTEVAELVASPDGSPGTTSAAERQVLISEIDEYLRIAARGLNFERDCCIFWYYYRNGMSAREIAAIKSTGLTAKGVESVIFRLTEDVRFLIVERRMAARESFDDPDESGFSVTESL